MSEQTQAVVKAQSKTAVNSSPQGSLLQRAAVNASPVSEVPPTVYDTLKQPGQPLNDDTQKFMESRFGHDFSGVRVHTDGRATESARAVNALAYTVGRNVVFGAGQYSPGTIAGKRLLAHELAHTIQQSQIALSPPSHIEISAPTNKMEGQAEAITHNLLANSNPDRRNSVQSMSRTGAHVARKADPNAVANMSVDEIRNNPDFIEKGLVRMEFIGAEVATLYYSDGTKLNIGLVPKEIKPPLETVDYHTSRSDYAALAPSDKELKFIPRVRELPAQGMGYEELLKKFSVPVKFTVEPTSGKIIPNHLNPVTAPFLCNWLRSAEAEYIKNFDAVANGMIKILEKEKVIIEIALFRAALEGLSGIRGARPPSVAGVFNPAQTADELLTATKTIQNPGLRMLEAATRLARMSLSADQKVGAILEFFKRIGFAISTAGVVDKGEYWIMRSEDDRYAFKFIKDTAEILYGKFDLEKLDYIWKALK